MSDKILNCVYCISSKSNGRFYVGSAKEFQKRKNLHVKQLNGDIHHNIFLQRHVNLYGLDDLSFTVLEDGIDVGLLISREQYYMDTLNPDFNICKKAGSRQGAIVSAETREKLRKSHVGQLRPPCSEETKKRMSEACLGQKRSPESRLKMSLSKKGVKRKPLSDEHKRNLSIARTGEKRGKQTPECIAKRTAALFGNQWNRGNENRNTAVIQLKNGKVIARFKSLKAAAEELNTTPQNICHALRKRTKSCKGFNWEYEKKNFVFDNPEKMV